jgi:hypothetical protein
MRDVVGSRKWALMFAAVGEAVTGLALMIVPSLVGELLFGEALTGVAISTARVAGIALVALGLACWRDAPLVGMLIYKFGRHDISCLPRFRGWAGGRPPLARGYTSRRFVDPSCS